MSITRASIVALGLLVTSPTHAQMFEPAMSALVKRVESLMGSLKVDTKQHSLSSSQTSVAMKGSAQGLAQTIVGMESSTAIRKAVARAESMQTGVNGLCGNIGMANATNAAKKSNEDVREAVNDFEVQWMKKGGSRPEVLVATQNIRRGVMCSRAELAKGLCSEDARNMTGVVPAGDSNASPWLLRRQYGTAEAEVGSIFVDTIAPPPTMKPVEEANGSVQEMLKHAHARRQMALLSMARGAMMDVVLRGLEGAPE